MSEEYLDLVDENGNLTGERELRSICHEKGLRHQTVHIFLVRKNSDSFSFLAHLRSKEKSANPNKWAMQFGGHAESGDTIEATVKKELHEEIGLTPEVGKLIPVGAHSFGNQTNKEYIHSFFYEFIGSELDLKFNDGEVQAVRWMTIETIRKEIESQPEIWANSMQGYESAVSMIPISLK